MKDTTPLLPVGIGIISPRDDDDDFFHEQQRFRFDDDAKRRANFDSNEYENQRKENHRFYRFKCEKRRRKDEEEERVVFFVFVAFTTRFSHNVKEGA